MWAALLFVASAVPLAAQLRAGAARRAITPDLERHKPVYLAGFGQDRVATRVHDDLSVRCLALSAGGRPLVLCGVDSIGLFHEDVERIRAAAREKLGLPADIVIAATHSHQAPDTMGLWGPAPGVSGLNEEYNRLVVERAAEAVEEAAKSARPARARLARVRNAELESFLHDNRPPVVHDAELVALSVSDTRGRPIATLVNWANHPEALGSKNTEVTADYCAWLYTRLEERLGGTAVFLNGAVGGMQSPLGAKVVDPESGQPAPDASFRKAEIIGRRVADLAADALAAVKPSLVAPIQYGEQLVEIPVSNAGFLMAAKAGLFRGRRQLGAEGVLRTPVGYIRMGGRERPVVEIALVPGEMYPELSVGGIERYPGADFPGAPPESAIKSGMKAPFRMLVGLANDEIGYIIPKAEWDEQEPWLRNAPRRWYGEVNSPGPETAPRVAAAIRKLRED